MRCPYPAFRLELGWLMTMSALLFPAMALAALVEPCVGRPVESATSSAQEREPSLWERLRRGFGLTTLDDEQIERQQSWLMERPEFVAHAARRARYYLYHVVEELEQRSMPLELALLPMLESGFDPFAVSPASAAGLWQLMPTTARQFDLDPSPQLDERRDVLRSTKAAVELLRQLHARFGDWPLALAAYNWGEGNLQRAISVNRAKGLDVDFASLRLPEETRTYVPRLYALRNLVLGGLDFNWPPVPDRRYFSEVSVPRRVPLQALADMIGTHAAELLHLNPMYGDVDVPIKAGSRILVPCQYHHRLVVAWSNLSREAKSLGGVVLTLPYQRSPDAIRFSRVRSTNFSGFGLRPHRELEIRSTGWCRRTTLSPACKVDVPPSGRHASR